MQESERVNTDLSEQFKLIEKIIEIIPKFVSLIKDFYQLPLDTCEESKFFDLFWEINNQLVKDGYISFYSNEDEMKESLGLKSIE